MERETRIFVPEYRQNLPLEDLVAFINGLVEIDQRDLKTNVIPSWKEFNEVAKKPNAKRRLEKLLHRSAEEVCDHPVKKNTFEIFLRRPHITLHAGASVPKPFCRKQIEKVAFDAGWEIASHGFNMWYGGGISGNMGLGIRGFNAALEEFGRLPDQYSIQVIPSSFVVGVKNGNGRHPNNEYLYNCTDAAVVPADFVSRREMLDSRCTAAIAAPGGAGCYDEITDILAHTKTGLRTVPAYALNPFIKKYNCGYYDPFKNAVEFPVKCGLQDENIFEFLHFKKTAQDVFAHLMPALEESGREPNAAYARYCECTHARPGVAISPARIRLAAAAAVA